MADTKISALTALTGVNVDTATDSLAIVDDSVTTTKKILVEQLRIAVRPVLGTAVATTSGTSHDFTGIPAGTRRITLSLSGVSTNGTSYKLVQLGDAGGIETSGYLGSSWGSSASATENTAFTTGFGIDSAGAANVIHGSIVLTLLDSTAFTWVAHGVLSLSEVAGNILTSGSKSLSAELTQIRLTTVNGTDAFDAGSINILYE